MYFLLPVLTVSYLVALATLANFRPRIALISLVMFVSISLNAIPWDLFYFEAEDLGVKIEGAVFGAAIVYALYKRGFQAAQPLLNPYFLLVAAFGILVVGYLFISNFFPYGVEKAQLFLFKCVLPVAVICILSPYSQNDYFVIAATLILTSLLIGINSIEHTDVLNQRAGTEMNLGSITIGRIIAMGVFLVAVSFRFTGRKSFLILPVSVPLAALLIYQYIATGSRGPAVSAIVAAGLVFFLRTRNQHVQRIAMPVVVLFVAFVAFSQFQNNEVFVSLGFNRILYLFQDQELGTSEIARIGLQQAALHGFLESNGLGLGTGGYAAFLGEEREWPHNMPLEIASELGFPGIAIFGVIVILTFWRWFKLVRRARETSVFEDGVVSLWIYFFLNSLVSYDLDGNFGFWITAVFPWLINIRSKDELASDAVATEGRGLNPATA